MPRELEAPDALRRFGSGWLGGVIGLALGAGGLLLVLSLRAPGALSMPEITALHRSPGFRFVVLGVLVAAFGCSALSLARRRERIPGTLGLAATLVAALLGGAQADALVPDPTPLFLGLDFPSSTFSSPASCSSRSSVSSRDIRIRPSSARSGARKSSTTS